MGRHVSIAVRMAVATALLFGLVYPLTMTVIAQVVFPRQADGSLVRELGTIVGSELIGQQFASPGYFHPRPSAAGKGYDATASGGSNLGPTSRALAETVRARASEVRRENSGVSSSGVPVDMVTASGSGLDPDISLASAYAQAPRVANARGLSERRVRQLVSAATEWRTLGFLGEPRINVLRVNRALDSMNGSGR